MKRKHVVDPFREPEKKKIDVPLIDGKETPGLARGVTKGRSIWSSKQK